MVEELWDMSGCRKGVPLKFAVRIRKQHNFSLISSSVFFFFLFPFFLFCVCTNLVDEFSGGGGGGSVDLSAAR